MGVVLLLRFICEEGCEGLKEPRRWKVVYWLFPVPSSFAYNTILHEYFP
jgi:hypothetical protein